MRAHTDEEILKKVLQKEKQYQESNEDKVDVAIDLDDEHGTCHTYVVTFQKNGSEWNCLQIDEISSM